jgi:hypothetical protein
VTSTNHMDRERMEELCCLSVLGELTLEEKAQLDRHLTECGLCRESLKEFERLSLIDLSAASVERMGNRLADEIDAGEEARLLGQVVALANKQNQTEPGGSVAFVPGVPACRPSLRKRMLELFRPSFSLAGWAVAAAVITISLIHYRSKPVVPVQALVPPPAAQNDSGSSQLKAEVQSWIDRTNMAEVRYQNLLRELEENRKQEKDVAEALSISQTALAELNTKKLALDVLVEKKSQTELDQVAELASIRTSLEDERAKGANLEAQLQDVTARVRTQRSELAKLEEVSAKVPARMPSIESGPTDAEARELFGARDLHIVDVYDVDHAGKSSRSYGRVYFVNRKLLVFYAFDLGNTERKRRAVAFQAWGFRQPDSTAPENLGLFYVDDAKLDRWVLRVNDPKILSNIDTLFVTMEPPGGSPTPKGPHLLLASLGGPPNHP